MRQRVFLVLAVVLMSLGWMKVIDWVQHQHNPYPQVTVTCPDGHVEKIPRRPGTYQACQGERA